jgi:hypothetical protein
VVTHIFGTSDALKNSPDQVYYLIPNNINFDDIKHEIEEAKVRSRIKLLATITPSTKKKQKAELPGGFGDKALDAIGIANRSEQRKRTSPTERNFEMLCRDVVKFPQKYVNRLLELEKELEEANELLKKLSLEKEQHISKLEQENEVIRAEFEEKVRMTGLSRLSILNPKWHAKYPHMCNYLFGFEKWDHFKAFVEAAFFECNVDVNVSGKGFITPSEKICMCCMMGRRDYRRPTVGSIYGQDPSTISSYTNEWVPKLGRIGHFLSELSLEKTHNFFDEDTARRLKSKYIYPDGTIVDFANM